MQSMERMEQIQTHMKTIIYAAQGKLETLVNLCRPAMF